MRTLILLVGLGAAISSGVYAEDAQTDVTADAQVPSLEPITQDISGRLDRLEQFLNNSALLDMLDVLEQLKLEVAELRGKIEVQTYNLEQLQQKQRDLYTDVDNRLQNLENNTGTVATAPSTKPDKGEKTDADSTASKTESSEPTEKAARPVDPAKAQAEYQRAFKLLKESRYDQALTEFKQYLQDYPKSDYSDNAQYWLGETHYVKQEYELAINEYKTLIDTYPDSQKASHALLKIGYSYAELGNASDAEKTLNKVKDQYPGTTAARLADDRLRKILISKESNS